MQMIASDWIENYSKIIVSTPDMVVESWAILIESDSVCLTFTNYQKKYINSFPQCLDMKMQELMDFDHHPVLED